MSRVVLTHTKKDGFQVEQFVKNDKDNWIKKDKIEDEDYEEIAFLLNRAQLSLKRKKILKHFARKKEKR